MGHPCFWLLLWMVLALPLAAEGNDSFQSVSERSILLVEPSRDHGRGFEDLKVALDAHLGSNEIEVRLHRIDRLPRAPSAQVVSIRDIARKLNVSAVIWFDIPRQTMSLLFTDQQGNEQLLRRRFRCIAQNMRGCGDAIGSKVTSALSSWIGWRLSHSAPLPESAKPALDNELSPIPLGDVSWNRPKPLVRAHVDAGYGFSFFRGTGGFTHGMHFGVGTVWWEHLKLQVSTDIVFPIERDSDNVGKRVEINRWPIHVLAGGVLPKKRWTFALALGLALDLMSFRKVSSDPFFDGVDFVNLGFATNGTVRYFIEDWFAVWVDLEVDFYGTRFVSSKHGDAKLADIHRGESPLRYGSVLATFAVGVAFSWTFYANSNSQAPQARVRGHSRRDSLALLPHTGARNMWLDRNL